MGEGRSSLSFNPGTTLGSYLIVEQIGRGGMATVYKAYEEPLTRHVAIKVLPEFFAEDKDYRVRFQVEAVAVAKLRHNNILTVFAYGEEEGVPYIVCEFVDGGTLAERLDGAMPTPAVAMSDRIISGVKFMACRRWARSCHWQGPTGSGRGESRPAPPR